MGYGFSSITVPVTLLFYTNRILNPALALVELVINSYVLFINRKSIPNIWWRVAPILIGLVIGVAIGSSGRAAHPEPAAAPDSRCTTSGCSAPAGEPRGRYILSLVHPS